MTEYVTSEQQELIDRGYPDGVVGLVFRLREAHRPTFAAGRYEPVVFAGCSCGETGCRLPALFIHIEDLKKAYAAKCDDLARETAGAEVLGAYDEAGR